jgi:hypothetical protein
MIETVNLSAELFAELLFESLAPLQAAMLEMVNSPFLKPGDSLYVQYRCGKSRWGRGYASLQAEDKMKVVQEIKHQGYSPDTPIVVIANPGGQASFLDGTHRACILRALGRPVPAIICEPHEFTTCLRITKKYRPPLWGLVFNVRSKLRKNQSKPDSLDTRH